MYVAANKRSHPGRAIAGRHGLRRLSARGAPPRPEASASHVSVVSYVRLKRETRRDITPGIYLSGLSESIGTRNINDLANRAAQ